MPCDRCGASVDTRAAGTHVCDEARQHEFALFGLRDIRCKVLALHGADDPFVPAKEVAAFEDRLTEWLATARGMFEQFYAERRRRA